MKSFKAKEFFSREDARKYSPFIGDDNKLVYWVKPSYEPDSGKRIKGSFFRHYPQKEFDYRKTNKEISIKKISDNKHKKTQELLMNILNKNIGNSLEWHYKDTRLSDFDIYGDLLQYVEIIEKEYRLEIKPLNFDNEKPYIIDIILLGPIIEKSRVILGAIEIENTHEAEFLKVLICKSLGFPLMTIDITEYTENEINEKLCMELLLETTNKNVKSRRRNYIYLHNLLLPIYIKKDNYFDFDSGHQYIIFMRNDDDIDLFKKYIKRLKEKLGLTENNVLFSQQKINNDVTSSKTMQENDIKLLTDNLFEYTTNRYIRLIMDRPENNKSIFLFHLVLCRLLAINFDCIVAYKNRKRGAYNDNEEKPIWVMKKFNRNTMNFETKRYCPKQLSEPIFKIIEEVNKYTK
jgi:hypothetical protein